MTHREAFWADAAGLIDWDVDPQRILDASNSPFYRWFPDGVLNTCYNALDRHIEGGRGNQLALIYDSPVTDTQSTFTYEELRDDVATLAGTLVDIGVTKGDTVIIYMPMIPEAVMAMLRVRELGQFTRLFSEGLRPRSLQRASMTQSRSSFYPRVAESNRGGSLSTSRSSTKRSTSPVTNQML